ncbi:GGDEF domain-containing protein [Bacillus taeanensis]|uniref:GGDEF domain-containing protein n=1 Tax=Bacillus taeanensis TaxID=273032 RepID=UPI001FE9C8A6|nr:GGDEF domain-containing protein [Bacillus taeanensis]
MEREIDLLMNVDPLIVDYYETITTVSQLAMNRNEEEIYDYVIVTKNEAYYGVVSIRNLLMKFAEVQAEMASFMNPLTGLPGNHVIDEKLNQTIQQKQFSVLYIDLDQFKAYNDTYGFKKGDAIIQETARILKENIAHLGCFVGHIGGDDFIAILNDCEYETLCSAVIKDFDEAVKRFYNKEHLKQQYIIAENRSGQIERIPFLSLSIAVVSNQNCSFNSIEEVVNEATRIKKLCKMQKQSCYEVNAPCCAK